METSINGLQECVGRDLFFKIIPTGLVPGGELILASKEDNPAITEDDTSELFQQFDACDEPITINGIPVVFLRRECHGLDRIKNTFHRGCDILVIDRENRILVPTRSPKKDLYPSMTDTSIGEHVKVNEAYIQAAIRGGLEELNLELDPNKLRLAIHTNIKDKMQWQFCHYYLYFLGDQQVQMSEEITNIHWIPISKLKGVDLTQAINMRPDHCGNYEYMINNIERFI